MSTVFVTGGTGLIGSNVCRRLREQGNEVRALVRPGSDCVPLRDFGVHLHEGDITNAEDVLSAADDSEFVIHCAAILGGAAQNASEHESVNASGLIHVLDAAETSGAKRTVTLGTTTYFDYRTEPLTEHSSVLVEPPADPYSATKRAAFIETMRRAAETLDACVVIPGGTFGPSPIPRRAMESPSYNLRLALALKGELSQAANFPVPWSYADDVAACAIAALDRGVSGEKYLAFSSPKDVSSTAEFLNHALEIAGNHHRVLDITAEQLDNDPNLESEIGPSNAALIRRTFPQPYYRDELTRSRLGHLPTPLDEALRETVEWITTLPQR